MLTPKGSVIPHSPRVEFSKNRDYIADHLAWREFIEVDDRLKSKYH